MSNATFRIILFVVIFMALGLFLAPMWEKAKLPLLLHPGTIMMVVGVILIMISMRKPAEKHSGNAERT